MGIGFARNGIIALALMLAACDQLGIGYTSAEEIRAAPGQYEGKEVKVRGVARAVTRMPLVDMRTFILEQDGGELLVITEGALPTEGERIALRGVVRSAAIIEGQALGLRVHEIERL